MGCVPSSEKKNDRGFSPAVTADDRLASSKTLNLSIRGRSSTSRSIEELSQWRANVAAREVIGVVDLGEERKAIKSPVGRMALQYIFQDLDTSSFHEPMSFPRYRRSIVRALCASPLQIKAPLSQHHKFLKVRYGQHSTRGRCDYMEDKVTCLWLEKSGKYYGFFGIFDGHNGSGAAQYLSTRLHSNILAQLEDTGNLSHAATQGIAASDEEFLATGDDSGSTLIGVIVAQDELVAFSVGDSQAVLCRAGKAIDLCEMHKPDNPKERKRIELAGGRVVNSRVYGVLAVARAIGDRDFKTSRGHYKDRFKGDLVTAQPHVVSRAVHPDDEFLIIGCDGLFDVLTPQKAVNYVQSRLTSGDCMDAQQAAEDLTKHAVTMGSGDNVSAVILVLHQTEASEGAVEPERQQEPKAP